MILKLGVTAVFLKKNGLLNYTNEVLFKCIGIMIALMDVFGKSDKFPSGRKLYT